MVAVHLPFVLPVEFPELARVELVEAIYDCAMPEIVCLDIEQLFRIAKELNLPVYATLSASECRFVICNYSVIGVLHHTIEVLYESPLKLVVAKATGKEEVEISCYNDESIFFVLNRINKRNLTKNASDYE